MKRQLPVHFVVPDSGPLISLALATIGAADKDGKGPNYLDLLKLFNRPIEIVDQIVYECTHDTTKPGALLIKKWFDDNQRLISVVNTDTGRNFAEAISRGSNQSSKHKGELAISEYLLEFEDYRRSEDEVVLVLFEEGKVAKMLDGTRNVHLLTTAAFLRTLDLKRIVSYDEVLASIRSMDAERGVLQGLSIDDPTEASDHDSNWTAGFGNG